MTARRVDCWHFAGSTLRDGRPLTVKGQRLVHRGNVVPCESGYHGSVRALDALQYAPGCCMVARVRLSGTIVEHCGDKFAASVRTNLTDYHDATRVLHEFACWCADRALDAEEASGRKVDARSREAIRVKRAWLDGKATDAQLAAARDDASAAASAAASDAAWAAAWAASMAAAWAAQDTELSRALSELCGVKP